MLRDKEAINAIVREVAGVRRAVAHVASTAKVQKKVIADCLAAAESGGWLPRYLEFPARGYTGRYQGCEQEEPVSEFADAA